MKPWLDEISTLVKARCPLIALTSFEEERIQRHLASLAKDLGQNFRIWTRTRGFVLPNGQVETAVKDPMAALGAIEMEKQAGVFLLKDFHPYLKDPGIVRMLRDLSGILKTTHKSLILLSPTAISQTELSRDLMQVEVPLPDAEDISEILDTVLKSVEGEMSEDEKRTVIDAAMGLTQDEIENVFARSLVKNGKIDPRSVMYEKKALVRKSGIMDFLELGQDMKGVGGLDRLKEWLAKRNQGFSKEVKDLGLPSPKGILLVGIPGCGKSLTARATASAWNLPLIRLDVGRVFAGIVGSSESNMRLALQTAEAVSPCVLWIDEIEKAFAGTKSGMSGDSGTALRVFGTFLTWMQEKEKPVFVVATANNIRALPPEFLRKGRFDEIFFVDLPSTDERAEIFDIQLKKRDWTSEGLDLSRLAGESMGFSGAELEQALIDARYSAFFHNREMATDDILQALQSTVPLSSTMKGDIEELRAWAQSRAVFASVREDEAKKGGDSPKGFQRAIHLKED